MPSLWLLRSSAPLVRRLPPCTNKRKPDAISPPGLLQVLQEQAGLQLIRQQQPILLQVASAAGAAAAAGTAAAAGAAAAGTCTGGGYAGASGEALAAAFTLSASFANIAGLNASVAVGLSGRLVLDGSNRGL
jgi:hypothetical protein